LNSIIVIEFINLSNIIELLQNSKGLN
jgi:hypothetical protein